MIIKVSIPNRFQLKTIPSFRTVLMPRQGEVHYIGGADILPAPLETEEEGRMISLLGSEDDKEARAALIEHTGNRLREPVSSQPVHVAAAGVMKQLCPSVKGVVYVPYQSVGTSRGILPAVFIDRMEIEQEGGRYSLEKPLIAITKQELSPSGEYQILIQKSD